MALHTVGVRHHSPACARLVEGVIKAVRPRFVLVEGPSDINDRIDELSLAHRLPIAIFSYAATDRGASSSWTPLCDYSPEWVALRAARDVGARALFMDLPAWHGAFRSVKNRYADRPGRTGSRLDGLCEAAGDEGSDALWDHLFELPAPPAEIAARLRVYFEGLRRDEVVGARDEEREAYMARWIAWATGRCSAEGGGDVVVVCGGFHAPVLEVLRRRAPAAAEEGRTPFDELETDPDIVTCGSYLVPYSFHRLDSFVGYEAGMPSPGFYQAVWEEGPAAAPEVMLFRALQRLRARKQLVSPADAIAALSAAHGLKALRGHSGLARVDVLDGLASALIKDALDAPLPWSLRGKLRAGTDPMLVEIVDVFSGDRTGELAPGTPRPPLVDDAFRELAAAGIELTASGTLIDADITTADGIARSRVFHSLRVLAIPGFSRVRAAAVGGAGEGYTEVWAVSRALDADAALIEAAAYGPTLRSAAAGKIEELLTLGPSLAFTAELLYDAALVGASDLGDRLLADVRLSALSEPSFAALGKALSSLIALYRHDALGYALGARSAGARGPSPIAAVIAAAFDRGLWLFEGLSGASAPRSAGDVDAVLALRDALQTKALVAGPLPLLDRDRAESVMRRRARDPAAPPALRGAALGLLWSAAFFQDDAIAEQQAVASMRAAARPESLGDYLVGLFTLAREEIQRARSLLAALDDALSGMPEGDFLVAVPSLRLAFSFFPPRERERIAAEVLGLHGVASDDSRSLLELRASAEVIVLGRALDRASQEIARRFGLDDNLD